LARVLLTCVFVGFNSDVTSLGVLDALLLAGVMSMDFVRRIPSKVTGNWNDASGWAEVSLLRLHSLTLAKQIDLDPRVKLPSSTTEMDK
jgi:hypothetical protein